MPLANNAGPQSMQLKMRVCGLAAVFALSLCVLRATAEDTENALAQQIVAALVSNDLDLALSKAKGAVRQYPQSAQMYQLLGGVQFKRGAKEDARAAFQRAIDLAPQDSINYFNLARVELSLDHYAEVVSTLKIFLRSEPQDAAAHVLLGRAYHNLN